MERCRVDVRAHGAEGALWANRESSQFWKLSRRASGFPSSAVVARKASVHSSAVRCRLRDSGWCEELEPACSRTPPRSASRGPSRPRVSSRTPSRARRRRTTQTPPRGATSPVARTRSVVPASPGVTHTPVGGQSVMEERGTTHRFVLSSVWRCSVGCRGPLLETLLGGCSE